MLPQSREAAESGRGRRAVAPCSTPARLFGRARCQSMRPALTCIIGARRAWIVPTISSTSILVGKHWWPRCTNARAGAGSPAAAPPPGRARRRCRDPDQHLLGPESGWRYRQPAARMAARTARRRRPSRPFDGASRKRARLERSCRHSRADSFNRIFRAGAILGSTREAARTAICSPAAARLENNDRGFHGSARCIGIEVLVDLLPSSPQTGALATACRSAGDLAGPVHEIHAHVGMCLKVQPPGRFGVAPAVHGHGDEVRAVLKVADHHRVDSACPPPDGPKTHGAPTAGLRPPQTESAPRRAVHAAVDDPEQPDEPAGRKQRFLEPQLRHVIDDARAWQARPSSGNLGTHRRTTTDGRLARPLAQPGLSLWASSIDADA